MRITFAVTLIATILFAGLWNIPLHGQGGQPAAQPAPPPPMDRAGYWPNNDIQDIWKDLEARQVINKRVMEGGSYSINVRIVTGSEAPLVHAHSCDVWILQAGTATAITGGELMNGKKRPNSDDIAGDSIRGGKEQALKAGDVLWIPPGLPHGFKDVKGFRAFLIRWNIPGK